MIIADENLDSRIIKILRDHGMEIFYIAEELKGVSDSEIIILAKKTNSIILTGDKDFGEWVFSHNEKNISVILLRFLHPEYKEIANILVDLLKPGTGKFQHHFTTITVKKIRSRRI